MDEQRKKELRREWGLDPERFTVVCAGQLQTRKGVMEFAKIAERLPQMQFVWAGNFAFGNMSDGHRELEQLLQNHPEKSAFHRSCRSGEDAADLPDGRRHAAAEL